MNWKGQTLPVLLQGLPSKAQIGNDSVAAKQWHQLSQPENDIIAKISPYAQILKGAYRTPTFLIHGKGDDLIPWQQTERFQQALTRTGVASEATILEDAIHLFDLYIDKDSNDWRAIVEGYQFLFSFINILA
jgi:acetyl esterase/lipase